MWYHTSHQLLAGPNKTFDGSGRCLSERSNLIAPRRHYVWCETVFVSNSVILYHLVFTLYLQ